MKKTIKTAIHFRLFESWFCCSLILIIGMISSCKKFIQVPTPQSQLLTSSVFSNNSTATSAVTNIYTEMYSNESYNISFENGELADELTSYLSPSDLFYINFTNPNIGTYGEWNQAYNYIFQANQIIEGLQQYSGTSQAVKQQLTGEAYFIRAFWHFYLTNCYGSVPLALTTDYKVTSQLVRTPRVQVLQQVIKDLITSQGLLNSNYVDASDTTTTTQRVKPNKAVASALLARAYLYLGDYEKNNKSDYQNAENVASSIISNSSYNLCTNLSGPNSTFLANSSEAIWQLYTPQPSNLDVPDAYSYVLISAPGNGFTISPQLLSAFESGDKRLSNWIGTISIGAQTYFFPYKYKNRNYTGTEYTMVLRLAEQYLIRAEARAEQGNTSQAISDLNIIRNRAGLANYTGATDMTSLLTAIQHERQVELFTEWGHRWFDLNRAVNTVSTINANSVLGSPGNVCQYKGGTWSSDDHQQLYPIPQSEIIIDHNLTQNPGY